MTIQKEIQELQPWFHNLHLPGDVQTAPDHFLGDFPAFKWKEIENDIPKDLNGWTVLDIGCNAGYYSIELAKRGAQVTGIDVDPHYLEQAEWAAKKLGLEDKISLEQAQVYDLAKDNRQWDLVWFMGVLYHLRYPLLALDILSFKTRRMMVFQTLTMPGDEPVETPEDMHINDRDDMLKPGWPKMAFIEHKLNQDPTNWWAANKPGVQAMLRSAGLRPVKEAGDEIFICEKDMSLNPAVYDWDLSEYLSATGKEWKHVVDRKVEKG